MTISVVVAVLDFVIGVIFVPVVVVDVVDVDVVVDDDDDDDNDDVDDDGVVVVDVADHDDDDDDRNACKGSKRLELSAPTHTDTLLMIM